MFDSSFPSFPSTPQNSFVLDQNALMQVFSPPGYAFPDVPPNTPAYGQYPPVRRHNPSHATSPGAMPNGFANHYILPNTPVNTPAVSREASFAFQPQQGGPVHPSSVYNAILASATGLACPGSTHGTPPSVTSAPNSFNDNPQLIEEVADRLAKLQSSSGSMSTAASTPALTPAPSATQLSPEEALDEGITGTPPPVAGSPSTRRRSDFPQLSRDMLISPFPYDLPGSPMVGSLPMSSSNRLAPTVFSSQRRRNQEFLLSPPRAVTHVGHAFAFSSPADSPSHSLVTSSGSLLPDSARYAQGSPMPVQR